MKRNVYIILTLLTLLLIILLQTVFFSGPATEETVLPFFDIRKLILAPYNTLALILIFFIQTGLYLTGVVNAILFFARGMFAKPFIDIKERLRPFPLNEDRASELFFFITLCVLFVYILEISIYIIANPQNISLALLLSLTSNLCLQAGIITLIFKYLKSGFLDFRLRTDYLMPLFRIYTASLPIILISILVNNFILEQIGISPMLNPAIELMLLLKNNLALFILGLQIVVLAPLAEEMLFRGLIYKFLRTKYSFALSCVLVSIFFSLLHRTPQNILPLFIISLALCYIYEKTQNITTPIIMHALHNGLQFCILIANKNLL